MRHVIVIAPQSATRSKSSFNRSKSSGVHSVIGTERSAAATVSQVSLWRRL